MMLRGTDAMPARYGCVAKGELFPPPYHLNYHKLLPINVYSQLYTLNRIKAFFRDPC